MPYYRSLTRHAQASPHSATPILLFGQPTKSSSMTNGGSAYTFARNPSTRISPFGQSTSISSATNAGTATASASDPLATPSRDLPATLSSGTPPQNQTPNLQMTLHSDQQANEHSPSVDGSSHDSDVETWLQITGYYDEAKRHSKLRAHRLRKSIEDKEKGLAAQKAELERLLRDEAAECFVRDWATPVRPSSALRPAPVRANFSSASGPSPRFLTFSNAYTLAGTKHPRPVSPGPERIAAEHKATEPVGGTNMSDNAKRQEKMA